MWLDDYKKYLYKKDPKRWNNIIVDKNKASEIVHRKQCKTFKFFLDEVAPDLVVYAPFKEQAVYAAGVIRSAVIPERCVSDKGYKHGRAIVMSKCTDILEDEDVYNQHWELTWEHNIRSRKSACLARISPKLNAPTILTICHKDSMIQKWRYNVKTKQIENEGYFGGCLEYDLKNDRIIMNPCSIYNPFMTWDWEYLNSTAYKENTLSNALESNDIIDGDSKDETVESTKSTKTKELENKKDAKIVIENVKLIDNVKEQNSENDPDEKKMDEKFEEDEDNSI